MAAVESVGVEDFCLSFGNHGGHGQGHDGSYDVRGFKGRSVEFVAGGDDNPVRIAHKNVAPQLEELAGPEEAGLIHPVMEENVARGSRKDEGDEDGE